MALGCAAVATPAQAARRTTRRATPKPALAIGASSDPAARFRLEGRDLTVVLDGRLTPRGFRGRPAVRIVCGDTMRDPRGITELHELVLTGEARRSLRVGAGTPILRARLDANVAAQANWCGLNWHSRAGNHCLWICVRQAALTSSGQAAWIATPQAEPGLNPVPDDRLFARAVDGRVVTVASGPTRSLTDPAISADGTSVTWREAGVQRSAPLP